MYIILDVNQGVDARHDAAAFLRQLNAATTDIRLSHGTVNLEITSLNLPDKYVSFLPCKVCLAAPVCSFFSRYETDNMVRHSSLKGNGRS